MRIHVMLFLAVMGVSCGGYNEGVVLKADKAYVVFKGNLTAVKIRIDDAKEFAPDPEVQRYELKPGKHTIQVRRNDQLVVNRVLVLDNQVTMEVDVP